MFNVPPVELSLSMNIYLIVLLGLFDQIMHYVSFLIQIFKMININWIKI